MLDQDHESSVRIALRQTVDIEELSAVHGVEQVEALDNGRYRVLFAVDANPDALLSAAVERHWGLYELVPEQQSLEDLFIELTHDEIADSETDAS